MANRSVLARPEVKLTLGLRRGMQPEGTALVLSFDCSSLTPPRWDCLFSV